MGDAGRRPTAALVGGVWTEAMKVVRAAVTTFGMAWARLGGQRSSGPAVGPSVTFGPDCSSDWT